MTVPFIASRSGADFGPQLSFYYDYGVGNEPFAFRSSVSLPWTGTRMATTTQCRISRDDSTTAYGLDASSYVADPADPSEIFSYPICQFGTRNARTLRRRGGFFKVPPPSLSGERSGMPILPLSDFSTYGNML